MRIFSVTALLLLFQVLMIEKGFSQSWGTSEEGSDADAYILNRNKTNNYTYLRLQTSTNQGWAMVNKSGLSWRYSATNPTGEWYHGIQSDASIRMMLTTGGNLGIGTTIPKKTLHVNGDIYAKGHVWLHAFEGDGNSGTAFLQARDDSGASDIGLMIRSQSAGSVVNAIKIDPNGHVGIGTTAPGSYRLAVEGKIGARGIDVKAGAWADFVFDEGYELRSLTAVEQYIEHHNHLPDVPSEAEVKEKGIDVSEMLRLQMQKIEELTLYVIELEKKVSRLSGDQ